jgi:hypothetical protein
MVIVIIVSLLLSQAFDERSSAEERVSDRAFASQHKVVHWRGRTRRITTNNTLTRLALKWLSLSL